MSNVTPTNEEYEYEGKIIISQTDLDGNITYVNKKFCEVSGYEASELIGQNLSIIKNDDMPDAVISKMWKSVQDGQSWNGLFLNLRKDGKFYWVDTEVTQIRDDKTNEITGYISVGRPASSKDIQDNAEQYKKMIEVQW